MKKHVIILLLALSGICGANVQSAGQQKSPFVIKGFHLDLRIQVMTMDALKAFALKLHDGGINTLIMEWEGTYPFEKHPLIASRYAYSKAEIVSFVQYCNGLGIDVIPLQQSFGHVEYILRNDRYKDLREDEKDFSQVCPLQTRQDSALFSDLYTELASTHTSKYIHIGGDETYLLGHDERCRLMAVKEGKSKLYINYIRMLCNIVIGLGKTPVLWADIALKYPDAIKLLPKGTVFIDWNYGWDMNNFGDHQKLVQSGYEIWGAPALRSSPDNYFLTEWEKHFKNIHDFVPEAAKLGYKGIVMTSWSTSGQYSQVFESENELTEEYAIRHVYPLNGFNMLVAAYAESIKSAKPLDIDGFITGYCATQYGLDAGQSAKFWKALKTMPYEIEHGEVKSRSQVTVKQMLDSTKAALDVLNDLQPSKNKDEFEHYRLMSGIRANYLEFHYILQKVNSPAFTPAQVPAILEELKSLMASQSVLDQRFSQLNKNFLFPNEIKAENDLRDIRVKLLYDRLAQTNKLMQTMGQQIKIVNGRVITPLGIINGGCVLIGNGKILAISDQNIDVPGAMEINAGGKYVSPGFIDIHVHGGAGHDFMDNTVEAFLSIANLHARYGTTTMLPTTLTSSREELLETLRIYQLAGKQNTNGAQFIGMHLEGPYFSVAQCGAQDPRYIRDPDPDEYMEILSGTSVIKRWSAAPELKGAMEFGRYVTSRGVLASIAHTDAIYEDVVLAVDNGYSLATHLYSGMSGVTRRNAYRYAGVIESALLMDELDVEIIADGIHLPAPLLKLVYKIKGAGKTALITDAMRGAGMPGGDSILGSRNNGIKVIIEDGVAKLPDRSAFAGSVATADRLVRNMIKMAGVSLLEAVQMATATPACIMKIGDKKGTLAFGKDADLVIFDADINVEMTIVNGNIVFNKTSAGNETAKG